MAFSIQFLVLEWKIYQLTNNVFHLGLIPLAEIIAVISFSLISGHIIDISKKRKSLLISLSAAIVVSFIFSFIFSDYFVSQHSVHFILYLTLFFVFLWGIIRAFYSPSSFSMYLLLIPKNVYPNAATWNANAWQLGSVIGPIIGGMTYAILEAENTLHITSVFLLLALFFVFQIPEKEFQRKTNENVFESLKQGFQFILKNKVIFSALLLDMVAVFFGGAVALLPVFVNEIIEVDTYKESVLQFAKMLHYPLHYTDEAKLLSQIQSFGLGILRSAMGIGAIISMTTISFFPVNNHSGKKLMLFIALFGLSIVAFGFSTHFWISFIILVFSGMFDGVSVVIRSTILQLLTPDDMRGRVSSVNSIFVGSSNEFGAFESGTTAKLFGTVRAVILGGSITVLVVFASYFKMKKLREFEIKDFSK